MCQDNMTNIVSAGCKDYSLLTANTNQATISTSNTHLDGSGATLVFTASGTNGAIVKSVIIKAIQPVTTGMVRLFVAAGPNYALYKEVPVPTTPALTNTPTPLPMLTTFEVKLAGGLRLQNGYKLYASTQNAESFNVIVEGLDWHYPAELPDTCCNFLQETAATGMGTVSTANTNLDGTGSIVPVFTAAASSIIRNVTVKALQSTNEGMLRFFISPNGSTWYLMKEVCVPQTTQSGFEPSFKLVLEENYHLKQNYSIGVATQIGQSFAITVEGTSWSYPIS